MSKALIDDMGVANVGFLIENLGKDAGELQYLRELVQNAFESIQRRGGGGGRVEIDYEEVKGVKKLRITDNGIGMTPDEVRENINRLSASAGTQAFDKNFGIGAKITAAVRNPLGVMYKTWKDNVGSITVLGRQEGRYGRIGWRSPVDDSVDFWLPLPDAEKPSIIQNSGVSVVLLGASEGDSTTVAPPGAELPSQWVAAYLERRYFKLPPDISLRVLRPSEIYDSGRGSLRPMHDTIRGQQYYLDKHSLCKGSLSLSRVEANVYWWVLTEDITAGGKTWNNRGHVASLFQNELYEVRGGAARSSALKDFGIYAGHNRIVIYLQPTNVLGANTARSALIIKGGQPVDHAAIGAAFAEDMPSELAAFMAGQVSSEQGDHRKSILRNLKEVEAALEMARYRRSSSARLENVEPEPGGRTRHVTEQRDGSAASGKPSSSDDAAGRVGNTYLRKARDEMDRLRAKQVETDPLPKIVWDEDGNAVPAGRAATYTHTSHVITANARFDFYVDLIEWGIEEAKSRLSSDVDEKTLRKICEDEIRRWIEESLAQAVVVLRPMAHDARWGPMVYETGLSDEGLTAAVISHRWLLLSAIKRGLAGRLGRMKEIAA